VTATKLQATSKKHRVVSFEEAATCLHDGTALVQEDPDAEGEQHFISIDMSERQREKLKMAA